MLSFVKGIIITMNILICDDNKNDADRLNDLLTNFDFNLNTVVKTDAKDTLEYIRSGVSVDVCFLDIIMPEINGVELAETLREEGWTGFIVFLSTSKDFGPESYKVKAFSYLLKPASYESVFNVLNDIKNAQNNTDIEGISIKGVGQTRFVLFRDISYVEAANQNVIFRLTNGSELKMRSTFAEVAVSLLEDARFIQCHRSYIVNMNDVASVSNNDFILRNGFKIAISRSFADAKLRYIRMISRAEKSEY